jgi:branched-subunit amino acid aminotransferase/4-amino-4-deoxychorismate lyase
MSSIPSFFESILYQDGKMPFLEYHYRRIEASGRLAKLEIKFSETEFKEFIYSKISTEETTAKLRVLFELKDHQLRLFNLETHPLDREDINSEIPVKLCIYDTQFKIQDKLANCKVHNSMIYTDSIEYAHISGYHHSIIINNKTEVVESSIASIYFIKNGKIYTPPLSSGCVSGVMRTILMENFQIEEQIIPVSDINEYQEIFLSNAVKGIILVNQVNSLHFSVESSHKMREKLNELFRVY